MKKLILSILVCTSFTIFAQEGKAIVMDAAEQKVEMVKEKAIDAAEQKVEAAKDKAMNAAEQKVTSAVNGTESVVEAVTSDKTTFYLITNGEKKAPSEKYPDPYLSKTGEKTSENWVKILANIKFDAVYAQEYTSAKQTAQFVSASQKLGIYQFDPATMYDESFKYITNGKTVLIVADSANLAKFANTVLGKETVTAPKEGNYSNLYIISNTKDVKDAVVLDLN